MKASERDRQGAAAARLLLANNNITVEVGPTGTHTLLFQSEERRGPTRLGHGPDLNAACLDAVAMLDDRSPEDVPTQALLLATLMTYDPVWCVRAVHTLYPADHAVTVAAFEDDDDEDEDEDDEEVVEGAFEDEDQPQRRRGAR